MDFSCDCLVLKIEEHDYDNINKLDTTLYIVYDNKEHNYVIRGKRAPLRSMDSPPYSFVCDNAYNLADFITFVLCREHKWTYVLYNYDNLPATSDELTFDFFKRNDSRLYEIAGYDQADFDKKKLVNILRMLQNVFNYYN